MHTNVIMNTVRKSKPNYKPKLKLSKVVRDIFLKNLVVKFCV